MIPRVRRIILFDIDGTLLSSSPAKDAFSEALFAVFGTAGDTERVSFAGKTDPQIAWELLTGAGLTVEEIESGLPAAWDNYLERLARALPARPVSVLPGVPELLDALDGIDDVGLGLLTGNIVRGAELKLRSGGLWGRFPLGAYGSDDSDRDRLPAVALRRAKATWGTGLKESDAVVVGDTPRDVQCGKIAGMATVAVATGHYSLDELRLSEPDFLLTDLRDTAHVVECLTRSPSASPA